MATGAGNMKLPARVDVEPDEHEQSLSERIRNWARFTVERRWSSATCRSIEGRYRPERLSAEVEAEKRAPKLTQADIDEHMRDAWEVESAWKELPELFRFCLQYTYLKGHQDEFGRWRRWTPRKVWYRLAPYRTLQLRVRNYDEVLRMARFALLNQLLRRRHR